MRPLFHLFPLGLALFLFGAGVCAACQVPVFRYALERWSGDAYRVAIIQKDGQAFTPEQQRAVDALDRLRHANLHVRRVGADELDLPDDLELPALALQYPAPMLREEVIWSAPLDPNHLRNLIDSPLRRALADRALAGDTAVWLMIESPDKAANDRGFAALQRHLRTAESVLEIPEGVVGKGREVPEGGDPENELQSEIPLQIKFSTRRLRPDDPVETVLAAMLLEVEPGLRERLASSPLFYPVFGQGRTLPALFLEHLSEESVTFACDYLCGACSCQVKRENPGFDLLLYTDWHAALSGIGSAIPEKILPPLEGVLVPSAVKTNSSGPAVRKPAEARAPSPSPLRTLVWLGGFVLLVVAGWSVALLRR